jgi:hypothetical protein
LVIFAVYFGWTTIFPPPKPTEAPPADVAAETAPATSRGETAPAAAPVPTTIDVPERSVAFQDPDYNGVVRSKDGALSSTRLARYHRAWHVTPLWNFAFDKVLGRAAEHWEPYVRDESLAQLLGSDASYVTAGTGRPGPDGGYLVEANGSAVTATRTLANGLTITKRYAPGDYRSIHGLPSQRVISPSK